MEWNPGELIWFDPGIGHWLPGEVLECHKSANVLTVQAVINGKVGSLLFIILSSSEIQKLLMLYLYLYNVFDIRFEMVFLINFAFYFMFLLPSPVIDTGTYSYLLSIKLK